MDKTEDQFLQILLFKSTQLLHLANFEMRDIAVQLFS